MLKALGITVGTDTKAGNVFESLFPNFMDVKYSLPSEYVKIYWDAYSKVPDMNSNLNGKIFEYILSTLCVREGILPLYLSAKVALYQMLFTI